MEKYERSFWLKWGLLGVALLLVAGCGPGPPPGDPEPPEPPEPPPNRPPVISSLTANPTSVQPGGSSTVTVTASDPDRDPLTYSWTANGGRVSPSSSRRSVTWTAPQTPVTYRVTVTVRDSQGGRASRSVDIIVVALPSPPREDIGVEYWQEVAPE